MNALLKKLQGDRAIWMVTFFLSLISILAVYSAISTLAYKADGNDLRFLVKHGLMIIMGLMLMYYIQKIKFKYISKLSQILIVVSVALLVYALLFGTNLNSADRWIKIPLVGLTFQPSDFAKIALIIYVSRTLALRKDKLDDFRYGVLPIVIPVVIICGLILPANFSTAALLGSVCFLLMYLGGVPMRHLGKLMMAGVAGILLIIAIGEAAPGLLPRYKTWKNRIINKASNDSDGNYQTDLAKYAIYEGGIFPKGPGSGSSRNFMPHPYSDMIYPFIIEEYGSVLGGISLVLLYLILLYRAIKLSKNNPKISSQLTALGLAFMLVFQAFINMGVAVSLFPTTGQPLPLVSMGGTSTLFTCLSIGLILSITRLENNQGENEIELPEGNFMTQEVSQQNTQRTES